MVPAVNLNFRHSLVELGVCFLVRHLAADVAVDEVDEFFHLNRVLYIINYWCILDPNQHMNMWTSSCLKLHPIKVILHRPNGLGR